MTMNETLQALENGKVIARDIKKEGSNVIGFGEMGIGNTTSASAIMSVVCDIPVAECVGKGTGLDDKSVLHKAAVIGRAIELHKTGNDPLKTLQTFGGYEIAQLVGAMLASAEAGMILMIDGFIVTAAFLIAYQIAPAVMDYAIFCHQSNEMPHKRLLDFLGAKPLLDLGMRLGEGTGAAVTYPIIQSAVAFLEQMASFESASVSGKN
jgi:nicotinate-nucleotide--dimethylbenzimidazole phosphoribosyltransferase